MADIIDFEDKRKKKLGNQNETEVEEFSEQSENGNGVDLLRFLGK